MEEVSVFRILTHLMRQLLRMQEAKAVGFEDYNINKKFGSQRTIIIVVITVTNNSLLIGCCEMIKEELYV